MRILGKRERKVRRKVRKVRRKRKKHMTTSGCSRLGKGEEI
jgi:hypothetical protein